MKLREIAARSGFGSKGFAHDISRCPRSAMKNLSFLQKAWNYDEAFNLPKAAFRANKNVNMGHRPRLYLLCAGCAGLGLDLLAFGVSLRTTNSCRTLIAAVVPMPTPAFSNVSPTPRSFFG